MSQPPLPPLKIQTKVIDSSIVQESNVSQFSTLHQSYSDTSQIPQTVTPLPLNRSDNSGILYVGDSESADPTNPISLTSRRHKSPKELEQRNTLSLHSEPLTESEQSEHSEPFSSNMLDSFSSSSSSIESNSYSPPFSSSAFALSSAPTSVTSSIDNSFNNFMVPTFSTATLTPDSLTASTFAPNNQGLQNLAVKFDISPDFLSSDPVTISYLVQSAIASTHGSKILSDKGLRDARAELRLLKSRQSDIEHKILMEKKIKDTAHKFATSGIGKWSQWEDVGGRKRESLNESPKSARPLSKHALDEVSLSTHNLNMLEHEFKTNRERITLLETTIQGHTAAILALTHPGSGTEFSWRYPTNNVGNDKADIKLLTEKDINDSKIDGINESRENIDMDAKDNPVRGGKTEERMLAILNGIYSQVPDIKPSAENHVDEDLIDSLESAVTKILTRAHEGDQRSREIPSQKNENNTKNAIESNVDESVTKLNDKVKSLQVQLEALKVENSTLKASVLTASQRQASSVILLRHQFKRAMSDLKSDDKKDEIFNREWDKQTTTAFENAKSSVFTDKTSPHVMDGLRNTSEG